jgi:hypothetical protein
MAGWAAPDPAISMILEAPQKGKKPPVFWLDQLVPAWG